MNELPAELAVALGRVAEGLADQRLARVTAGLIERYRADRPAQRPIVGSGDQAAAYVLYRMPATYAAVRAVLEQVPDPVPRPETQLDLGGGSGAACWAAADRWPDLRHQTVVDGAPEMMRIGARLGADSSASSVRQLEWLRAPLDSTQPDPWPSADLVTISYVLSELEEQQRHRLVHAAASAARRLLVLVEPGTSAGYRRVLTARDQLLRDGWHLVAPCPHQAGCPMTGTDWCHVAARINRSAVHRRLKQADLPYEDEKFSYLVVSREPGDRPAARVVRRPRIGKGRVDLTLCTDRALIEQLTVGKSDRGRYRPARTLTWGDPWPPVER